MSVGGLKKSKTEESFPSYHFIALTYFVHTLMTSGQSLMCQLHNVEAFLFELPKSRMFNFKILIGQRNENEGRPQPKRCLDFDDFCSKLIGHLYVLAFESQPW